MSQCLDCEDIGVCSQCASDYSASSVNGECVGCNVSDCGRCDCEGSCAVYSNGTVY